MKKEIIAMISKGNGSVKINDIATLHHWSEDAMGNKCDMMNLEFKYIGGVKGGKSYEVSARDYDGIISEVSTLIHKYMSECADAMVSNLKNGYRG